MKGRIHSIESFGTVDGPGVRLVVFFQGCPMRCQYCHNPDTWALEGGTDMSVEEILAQYEKNQAFYSRGGITATGGEPLLQMEFVTALFEAAARLGIHTCLDTSGILFRPDHLMELGRYDRLMSVTDLVLLDIKHTDPQVHRTLTGRPLDPVLAFARYLDSRNVPVWVRQVAVPGITTDRKQLYELGRFLGGLKNVQSLEVLPYHTMGVPKYQRLGMEYPLEGVPPMEKAEADAARRVVLEGMKAVKREAMAVRW